MAVAVAKEFWNLLWSKESRSMVLHFEIINLNRVRVSFRDQMRSCSFFSAKAIIKSDSSGDNIFYAIMNCLTAQRCCEARRQACAPQGLYIVFFGFEKLSYICIALQRSWKKLC